MFRRRRNGIEGQVAERAAHLAEFLQLLGDGDLVQLAFGRLAREPAKEARQRRAVADMRLARTLDLDGILAGLR